MSNAEEGRAAFNAMIHCFNENCKIMQALGAQYERVAAVLEEQIQQNDEIMAQNRKLMEYMGSLQSQMGVLATVIADTPVALPAVELPQPYDPIGALGQQLFNSLGQGLSGRGRGTPRR